MMLEEMFVKLADYDINCRTYEGHFLISLQFNPNWVVLEPTDEKVQCRAHQNRFVYCAPVSDGGLDAIFKAIQETINYNEDAEKKMELFQQKSEELSKIFINYPYEKLKDLTFTFQRKSKKKRQQSTATISQDTVAKEESIADAATKESDTISQTVEVDKKEDKTTVVAVEDGCGSFLRHNSNINEGDGFDNIEIPEEGIKI